MPKIELIQGDCLEKMRDIPDGSIDAIITDPPYGTTACKWDSVIPFEPMWEQLNRVIKKNGAVVLFGSQPFTSALIMSNIGMFKYCWTWHKNRPTGGAICKIQPMKCIEDICVFYKNAPTYNPRRVGRTIEELKRLSKNSLTKCDSVLYGLNGYTQKRDDLKEKYPTNYLNIKTVFSRSKEKAAHPTQKPVALMEYLIKTYTNECETVLDFTMGSGTTGVACKKLNRNFIGIELDSEYFKIAEKRINENL
jgi:site-specific DNA-methyltransferase (adenine-specific)